MLSYVSFSRALLLSTIVAFVVKRSEWLSRSFSPLPGAFITFLILSTIRITWRCYVYPKYRSPLRHLPQPFRRSSPIMGHFWHMIEAGSGPTFRSWANSVPNDGIIRYLDFFNTERLVIVKPAALADVLVYRNYDFEKPPHIRKGISRILGMGLFLAEGETHKVSVVNQAFSLSLRLFGDANSSRRKENISRLHCHTGTSKTCIRCSGINRPNL